MGAFVTIAANGQDALRAIDADQLVLAASFSGSRLRIFDSAGTQVADLPLGRDHPAPRTIPRAALSRILREEAMRRGVRIEYGKQFTTAEASGAGVRTFFADGSYADADLLIGAGGIHSPVRTLIDLDAPAPRYTGLIIACGYADNPTVTTPEAGSYDMIHGSRAFFGHTTGPDRRGWWFARIPSPELATADLDVPTAQWRDRLADAFAADSTPAAELIRATSGPITTTNAYDIPALPVLHNDSMTVIGDAAHATSPLPPRVPPWPSRMPSSSPSVCATSPASPKRSLPSYSCAVNVLSASSKPEPAPAIPARRRPARGKVALLPGYTDTTSTGTRPSIPWTTH